MKADQFDYTPESVAIALQGLWGSEDGQPPAGAVQPDPTMPRSASDPAIGGSWLSHLADARRAWKLTPLNLRDRRAVFMRHGLHWTQQEIADYFDVTQQTIQQALTNSLAKIAKTLNGEPALA